ncbi:twin transmembrane helix small protein [Motiliproteus sediminis]|uniref:twin transmembrane helix small protein n=1 Tax=Motiliproteus sediminis TaxID=1468178 RepID=UPI001AEF6546|nr:twin transmembrane helix small protein [Motiliproteus sediminis]
MGFKLLVLVLFAAVVISLFAALYFLITDSSRRQRTVNALALRVLFSLLLIATLLIGFYTGHLQPHGW